MTNRVLKAIYAVGWLGMSTVRLMSVSRALRAGAREPARITETRRTPAESLLLFLAGLGNAILPGLYVLTRRLDWADYHLPRSQGRRLGAVGAGIYAAAVWLLWRSHADLGPAWSPTPEVLEEQALVTDGVYRHIRHPMYAAHWLWGIAQALLLQNWVAGWANLASLAPLYLLRVPHEERMMLERLGESCRAYMARTGRILPRPTPRMVPPQPRT